MTILVFLVDTSLSMGQRSYQGCSFVDVAKTIIDSTIKLRSRDLQARSGDRYMLITTEDYPKCVKTGWREGNTIFNEQLKNMKPHGGGNLAAGIASALRFLNINRSQSGIDNFGCGRFPCYIEPAVIITITDTYGANVLREQPIVMPAKIMGTELIDGAFRWDQRLYMVVLRMPGHPPLKPEMRIGPDVEHIDKLCTGTGGRSYGVANYKTIPMIVENMVQSIQITGVFVKFEVPTSLNRSRQHANNGVTMSEEMKERIRQRGLIHLFTRSKPSIGHWPIPEAFATDSVVGCLPPRKPHPTLSVLLEPCEPIVPTDFPFDKYELENSPLTEWILEQKRNICFQVFMRGSDAERQDGWGKPFGYLKAATNSLAVNLFLMPYDYPIIFELLEQFKKQAQAIRQPTWKAKLDRYLESIPAYYFSALKKAFLRIQLPAPQLEDNSNFQFYPASVHNYLTQMKARARMEIEHVCADVSENLKIPPPLPDSIVAMDKLPDLTPSPHWKLKRKQFEDCRRMLPPLAKRPRSTTPPEEEEPAPARELTTIHVEGPSTSAKYTVFYRNPFAIKRDELPNTVHLLTENLEMHIMPRKIPILDGGLPGTLLKLNSSAELHHQPISTMGNYQEYMKALEIVGLGPMRELEQAAVRTHAFGNPFKIDKKAMAIDEVGESVLNAPVQKETRAARKEMGSRPPKRKPGPLSRNSFSEFRQKLRSRSEASSSVVSDISYTSEDLNEDLKEADTEATSEEPMVNGDDDVEVLTPIENIENGIAELFSDVLPDEEPKASEASEETPSPSTTVPSTSVVGGLEEEADDSADEEPSSSTSKASSVRDVKGVFQEEPTAALWGLDEEADDPDEIVVLEVRNAPKNAPKPTNHNGPSPNVNGGVRGNGHIELHPKAMGLGDRKESVFQLKMTAAKLLRRNNSRTVNQELQKDVFCKTEGRDELVELLKWSAREAIRFRRFALAAELETRASNVDSSNHS